MSNTIKLKRGSGSDPSASDLVVGELAIRTDTGKIFLKKDNGNVAEVSGGGGVADGDKGDITVSNSGDTFTIDNNAITTNKIANNAVSSSKLAQLSQNRILGRVDAGTGDVQFLTRSEAQTVLNVEDGATADQTASEILSLLSNQNISTSGSGTFNNGLTVKDASGSDPTLLLNHSAIDVTGEYIRVGRTDNNIRYHSIKAQSSQTIANNFISFHLHSGGNTSPYTNQDEVLKLQGNKQVTIAGNLDVGAGLDVTGNLEVNNFIRSTNGYGVGSTTVISASRELQNVTLNSSSVTATTQSAGDNSTKIATTAYTDTAIANLIDSSPSTLNTLNELASALGDDPNFATTVTNSIATKMPLGGGVFTGDIGTRTLTPASGITNADIGASNLQYRNLHLSGNISVSGTVDGRDIAADGSKLDTYEANGSSYLRSDTGDNVGGTLTFISGSGINLSENDIYLRARVIQNNKSGSDGLYIGYANSNTGATRIYGGGTTSGGLVVLGNGANNLQFNSNTVWHAGNDGSGSGLDADTLDGVQGGSFLRSDADDTASNFIVFNGDKGIRLSHTNQTDTNDGVISSGRFGTGLNIVGSQTTGGTGRQVRIWGEVLTSGGAKYWQSANDGSGSGLDADTLDGVEGSNYLRRDQAGSITGALTIDVNGTDDGATTLLTLDNYIADIGTEYTWIDFTFRDSNANATPQVRIGAQAQDPTANQVQEGTGDFVVQCGVDYSSTANTMTEMFRCSHEGKVTSVHHHPQSDSSFDLGTSSVRWRNIYADTLYGNGSNVTNVNAATLDGIQASSFLRSDTGDSMTAQLTIINDGGLNIYSSTNAVGAKIKFSDTNNQTQSGTLTYKHSDGAITTTGGNSNDGWVFEGTETRTVVKVVGDIEATGNMYASSGDTVFHTGNDGSGSGLDADTLDGQQQSYYWNQGSTGLQSANRISTLSNFNNSVPSGFYQSSNASNMPATSWHNMINVRHSNTANDHGFQLSMSYYNEHLYSRTYKSGSGNNDGTFTTWAKQWADRNDGSASGLDADTVDGIQGSSFIRSDTDDAIAYNHQIRFYSNSAINTGTAYEAALEVYGSNGSGTDAFMAFHVSGDYAAYFGLDGGINDFAVGGWSMGAVSNRVWHAGNDGSGSGLDADTVDGLNVHTATNNEANKIVRTDSNGYANFGWINTPSGDTGSASDVTRFFCSNDNYIRYIDKTSMRSVMNVSANSRAYGGRETSTTDQNYWIGSTGWGTTSFDTLWNYGSCFFDTWSNPSNQPSGTSHWTGVQAMHYNAGAKNNSYGYRIVCGAGQPALAYIGGQWGGSEYSWQKLWNGANDGSGSGLDADTLDGTQANALIRGGAQSSVSGWHISGYRNGNGTSPHIYFSHSSGYGQHINTYNTSDSIYNLELHSNSKQLFVVYNSGRCIHGGNVLPASGNTYDLGSSSARWNNVYVNDMHFSNEGKTNDVDGSWGDWTLQEGENDIFMINNRSGKKFKIAMIPV